MFLYSPHVNGEAAHGLVLPNLVFVKQLQLYQLRSVLRDGERELLLPERLQGLLADLGLPHPDVVVAEHQVGVGLPSHVLLLQLLRPVEGEPHQAGGDGLQLELRHVFHQRAAPGNILVLQYYTVRAEIQLK